MPLRSTLIGFSWKQPPPLEMSYKDSRRDDERFEVHRAVLIGPPGRLPMTGFAVNLSASGAAIQIDDWDITCREAWLIALNQSDELWLAGLLPDCISCWVVTFDDGVLRVHFSREAGLRHLLREAIERLRAA